ncbi:MAG: flagellar biosynthetic protein FliR [Pseudomonadota bacterium]
MLTFTEAQLMQWIGPYMWAFIRILALLSSMPVLSQRVVPARVKVMLAMLVAVCAQASLPAMPVVALESSQAVLLVVQQLLIGISLGFAARMVFAAVELAGDTIGLQMGLNFAMFFDPSSGGQVTSLSRFFGAIVTLLFVTINGHLLIMVAVVQSFHTFPVGPEPFAFLHTLQPQVWGGEIFRLGLWIALPLTAMLLFTNLVLGVIARVAPQLNVFAIGFPITVGVGLIGALFTLPMMQVPFTMALEQMLARFQ